MDSVPPPEDVPREVPTAPAPVAPAAPAPPRRFSWRDFLLGLASGVVVTIVGIVVLFVGFALFVANMASEENAGLGESSLSAPRFPARDHLTAFGQADMNWSFQTMAGETVTLGDSRDKIIFLNVWATWCGPCIAEMASLERLRTSLAKDPVEFVFISEEDMPKIKQFVDRKALTLPIFRAPSLPKTFQTGAIPATFVIDRSGTVVYRHVGAADWSDASAVTFLQGLAGAGSVER
jgi:thiol-disulfide isomerase/thioredoxin